MQVLLNPTVGLYLELPFCHWPDWTKNDISKLLSSDDSGVYCKIEEVIERKTDKELSLWCCPPPPINPFHYNVMWKSIEYCDVFITVPHGYYSPTDYYTNTWENLVEHIRTRPASSKVNDCENEHMATAFVLLDGRPATSLDYLRQRFGGDDDKWDGKKRKRKKRKRKKLKRKKQIQPRRSNRKRITNSRNR